MLKSFLLKQTWLISLCRWVLAFYLTFLAELWSWSLPGPCSDFDTALTLCLYWRPCCLPRAAAASAVAALSRRGCTETSPTTELDRTCFCASESEIPRWLGILPQFTISLCCRWLPWICSEFCKFVGSALVKHWNLTSLGKCQAWPWQIVIICFDRRLPLCWLSLLQRHPVFGYQTVGAFPTYGMVAMAADYLPQ